QQVVVRSARDQPKPGGREARCQRLSIGNDLLLIGFEIGPKRLTKSNRLGRDNMYERPALNARENAAIDVLRKFFFTQDQSAAGASKRLVRGGRHVLTVRHGRGVKPGGYESRDMGNVGHDACSDAAGDLTDAGKIDGARVCRGAADEQLWPAL